MTRLRQVRPFALQETMLPAAALTPTAQVGIDALLVGGRRLLRRQVLEFLTMAARSRPGRAARRGAAPLHAGPPALQRRPVAVRPVLERHLSAQRARERRLARRARRVRRRRARAAWRAVRPAGGHLLPAARPRRGDPARADATARGRSRTRSRSSRCRASGWSGTASDRRLCTRSATRRPRCWTWSPSLRPVLADADAGGSGGGARRLAVLAALDLGDRRGSLERRHARDRLHARPDRRRQPAALVRLSDQPRRSASEPVHPRPSELRASARSSIPTRSGSGSRGSGTSCIPPGTSTPSAASCSRRSARRSRPSSSCSCDHRPASLGGRRLREVLPTAGRDPRSLTDLAQRWRTERRAYRAARASLAFAVLGQARWAGLVSPEDESRIVSDLLTFSAVRSTLDLTQTCSAHTTTLARAKRAAAL